MLLRLQYAVQLDSHVVTQSIVEDVTGEPTGNPQLFVAQAWLQVDTEPPGQLTT